jgi:pilus assembly protein CpaC
MARLFSSKLLLASLALMPVAASVAPASAQRVVRPTSQDLVLSIGNGKLVNVGAPMADIFIANDAIADVQIKSQRQLYVFGKAGGTTTVYASNAAGEIIWSANIRVGSNIDSVDQMLGLAMPEAKIAVTTMGQNTVLLTGTVAAPEDAAEAQRLVEAFVGAGTNVISRLKTATPLQVNLRVRIAEVSRNFSRTVGSNLFTVDQSAGNGFKFGVTNGRAFSPTYTPGSPGGLGVGRTSGPDGASIVTGTGTGSTLAAFGRFLGLDIGTALDLAEQDGLLTTLAEPNLTALSGETASFLAGGEFPVITNNGLSGSSVSFKKFGVSLSYTPVVLANGRISLRVKPEVSEISSLSVVSNGNQIPSLSTRSAETTVELGSGQSFMIAGLIQNNAVNTIDKTPGLGDVPVLGNLFRSSSFRRGETELVIVVTPYLVKPVEEADVHLPTDGFQSPTEIQRLLGNQFHDGKSNGKRPMPTAIESGAAAAPQVGAVPAGPEAATAAHATQPRREEKVANAAPGFSFK